MLTAIKCYKSKTDRLTDFKFDMALVIKAENDRRHVRVFNSCNVSQSQHFLVLQYNIIQYNEYF